jgi:hypothetical protein
LTRSGGDTREFGGEAFEKGVHMPKSTGSRYTQEFKVEAVRLAPSSPERSIHAKAFSTSSTTASGGYMIHSTLAALKKR